MQLILLAAVVPITYVLYFSCDAGYSHSAHEKGIKHIHKLSPFYQNNKKIMEKGSFKKIITLNISMCCTEKLNFMRFSVLF